MLDDVDPHGLNSFTACRAAAHRVANACEFCGSLGYYYFPCSIFCHTTFKLLLSSSDHASVDLTLFLFPFCLMCAIFGTRTVKLQFSISDFS